MKKVLSEAHKCALLKSPLCKPMTKAILFITMDVFQSNLYFKKNHHHLLDVIVIHNIRA